MPHAKFLLKTGHPQVVGSFGSSLDLRNAALSTVQNSCNIAEIRLDLLDSDEWKTPPWQHLSGMPLLFTARRAEEGGAQSLNAATRIQRLRNALEHAACIDIEVASIDEMSGFLDEITDLNIPWIASYHDFRQLPSSATLGQAAEKAKNAGAAVFKAAAHLHSPAELALLAEFQLADHGIPVATMGMGPLAPVSRLLCAQCGSHLNYGYLGSTATAPGQWDSALLKQAITRLVQISRDSD